MEAQNLKAKLDPTYTVELKNKLSSAKLCWLLLPNTSVYFFIIFFLYCCFRKSHVLIVSSGGSKRDARDAPLGPNSFIFMQFSAKSLQTPLEILDPPLVSQMFRRHHLGLKNLIK